MLAQPAAVNPPSLPLLASPQDTHSFKPREQSVACRLVQAQLPAPLNHSPTCTRTCLMMPSPIMTSEV